MHFLLLNLATFLVSFGLGYSKFFGLGYICHQIYSVSDKGWVIQAVGALITVGPAIIYFLAGPLASSRKKRLIMSSSAVVTGLLYVTGALSSFLGTIWAYIFMLGTLMGFFNSAKMSCVPLEATRSGKSTVYVNGILTISFIMGMLMGVPAGAAFYEYLPQIGPWFGAVIFFAAAIASWFLEYPQDHLNSFRRSFSGLLGDTTAIFSKFWPYLIAGPMLWGVAGAISLAITAYAEHLNLGGPVLCANMGLWAAIGIIVGNIVSNYFINIRYTAAFASSVFLVLCIYFYPELVAIMNPGPVVEDNLYIYIFASVIFIILATFFGIVTNLIDADFLRLVADDKKEGSGAALQSALVSFFNFALNGIVFLTLYKQILNSGSQFTLLAALTLVATVPVLVLMKGNGGMKQFFGVFLTFLGRFLLSLRYKVKISGLEHLKQRNGLVVMPNHPGEIDPVIICSFLWLPLKVRPLAIETFYHMPVLNSMMRVMDTIPVPDLEDGFSSYKVRRTAGILKQAAESLRKGDNLLIYPSGGLMRSGSENLKGASGVHQILQEAPEAIPVLVRTRGLWGSSFSTALTNGRTPELVTVLVKGIKILLKNLIFFAPRRQVEVTIEVAPPDMPRTADKKELNQWLQDWYNAKGEEPLSLVSYSFWSEDLPVPEEKSEVEEIDLGEIPEDIFRGVLEEFSRMTGRDIENLKPEMSLGNDLGLDSVDQSEILVWMAERFHALDVAIQDLKTIGSVMKIATGSSGKLKDEEIPAPKAWWDKTTRPKVELPVGETLAEAFLRSCDRMGTAVAVADEMSGVLTYKRMKLGAIVLSKVIAELPGDKIGIMLPATAGVGVVTFAALLAHKTPVMINWTLGSRNLDHVQDLTGIHHVITSLKFLDKVGDVTLGTIEEKFLFVEEIRRDRIGLLDKISGALKAMRSADSLVDEYQLGKVDKHNPAVILFTSGSETVPKGVPLSHDNILSNIRSALQAIDFESTDCVYGFLPPFHSFGLTVTTVLPITSGLKAAFYPNPNESRRLARGTRMWKATVACGTPSFLAGIFKASENGQLDSLRYLVAGAEKAPDELFTMVEKLGTGAQLLEGYGITECSPILTMNRPGEARCGVGKAPPGVEIRVVRDETYEALQIGERGMIIASGANIFAGYLGENPPYPFHEMDGKRWYVTGDLGFLNQEGALTISGRKKRFVKVAGEMISLPAMEEALFKKWPISEEGPVVAVEALEREGERPILCLFTAIPEANLEDANNLLREAGFSNVGRLNDIKKVDGIPLLGSGKTDYRSLKSLLVPVN